MGTMPTNHANIMAYSIGKSLIRQVALAADQMKISRTEFVRKAIISYIANDIDAATRNRLVRDMQARMVEHGIAHQLADVA